MISEDIEKLESAKGIKEIMGIEGDVAWKYWNEFAKATSVDYVFVQG
jgi:CRISPR-associated protein Cas1